MEPYELVIGMFSGRYVPPFKLGACGCRVFDANGQLIVEGNAVRLLAFLLEAAAILREMKERTDDDTQVGRSH